MRVFLAVAFLAAAAQGAVRTRGDKVEEVLSRLTLEQKVGQLLMLGDGWRNPGSDARFKRMRPGSVCLAKHDVQDLSPGEVAALVNRLQRHALSLDGGIPLLVATDQEGGRVNRLKKGFALFPGARRMAEKCPDSREAARTAVMTARQLKAVGVHINFAPVLDVDVFPGNAVSLQGRTFSGDPSAVADWGELVVRSFQREGVTACPKHFPNDGGVEGDPHRTAAVNRETDRALREKSLVPYRRLISRDLLKAVMVSHAEVPAWGGGPASSSPRAITGILREGLGFPGVVVTDELNMRAFPGRDSPGEQALRAVQAGVDVLFFAGEDGVSEAAYDALLRAAREGTLDRERLDASVRRVLQLKWEAFGLERSTVDEREAARRAGTPEQMRWATELRERSSSQ